MSGETGLSEEEETCVFDEPDCGPVVFWDQSGEPWCEKCRQQVRRQMICDGLNDPERPLQ